MATKGFTRSDELNKHMRRGTHGVQGRRVTNDNGTTASSNPVALNTSADAASTITAEATSSTESSSDNELTSTHENMLGDEDMEDDGTDSSVDIDTAQEASSYWTASHSDEEGRSDSEYAEAESGEALDTDITTLRRKIREREWRIDLLEEMVAEGVRERARDAAKMREKERNSRQREAELLGEIERLKEQVQPPPETHR